MTKKMVIPFLMLAATLIYGGVRMYQYQGRMDEAPTLNVGLVEGDVGIFERESMDQRRDHLLIQQRLSAKLEAEGVELVIWPESAYRKPTFLHRETKRMAPAKVPLPIDPLDDYRGLVTRNQRLSPIRGFDLPLMFGSTSVEPIPEPAEASATRGLPTVLITPRRTAGLAGGRYDHVLEPD